MTDKEKTEYADVVWVTFLQRLPLHDRPLTMSSLDWELLRGWMETPIPLRVVLRGLMDTREKGRTLRYYGPSVRGAYEHWRQAVPL
jgi:hypothetical protein